MKIFYHNDMDGKCAAHIVLWKNVTARKGAAIIKMQYGDEFPFESIKENEIVYILDYSIEPVEMKRLLEITENVIWIDHHKTAIEKYADFLWVDSGMAERTASEEDISGLRRLDGSGCELTFWYMEALSAGIAIDKARELTPRYIRYIGDRDTWTWKYGEDTKDFFNGMLVQDLDPPAPIWNKLANDDTGIDHDRIIRDGKLIGRYRDLSNQESILDNAFPIDFEGYDCIAVNGRYDSKPFEKLFPEKDIWITFRYLGKNSCWMVSLYSTKVDVGEIAKQYEHRGKRGGGHKGAAGFECDFPPFLPVFGLYDKVYEKRINLYYRDGTITESKQS